MSLISVKPFALLDERLDDRQVGHKSVMAALPPDLGPQPRSTQNVLWWRHPDDERLYVQADCDVRGDILGEVVGEESLRTARVGSRWRIDVDFDCQKTPPSQIPPELHEILKNGRCYRSRKVVVPVESRREWAIARLARSGFSVDEGSLAIGPLAYADLGRRGGGIPFVRVQATGEVSDATAWSGALQRGIGKGKSFGLGLVLAEQIVDNGGEA